MPDIYFEPKYAELHEEMYQGVAETYIFNSEDGRIQHTYIKREIPITLDGGVFYDLITPYGYGGPIITDLKGDKIRLINDFIRSYLKHNKDNNVVAEFVRFHPLLRNHDDFKGVFDVSFVRHTVGTILDCDDPFLMEFSKSARKATRQALKNGFTYEIIERPTDLEIFKKIYYDTMDRNKAEEFYYFNNKYFDQLISFFKNNLLNINVFCGKNCISSGLYFVYGNYLHAHLSGTRREYLKYNPAYILKYLSVNWGKKNQLKYIHYGGGTTNSLNDTLLAFKKKFTKNSIFDFYIGKNIYDINKYQLLCGKVKSQSNDFFPKYRANE